MPPAARPPQPSRASYYLVAAILSYVRQAWGNKAGLVTPEQVKAVADQVGKRTIPFTPEDLVKVPEK